MWRVIKENNRNITLWLIGIQWVIALLYIFLVTHQNICPNQMAIHFGDTTLKTPRIVYDLKDTKSIQKESFDIDRNTEQMQKETSLEKDPTIVNRETAENISTKIPRFRILKQSQICMATLGLGIGNRIFQFAGIFGITNGTILPTFSINATSFMDTFDVTLPDARMFSQCGKKRVVEKYCCQYDEAFTVAGLRDVVIRAYFQSWRYFHHVEPELRSVLKFHNKILQTARLNLKKLGLSKNDTIVNIHVRRGDMVHYERYGFKVAPMSYINNAMEYFKEKYPSAKFIVYSNDMAWCKVNLQRNERLVFAENNSMAVDLAMASLGTHTIMTVGTYGWWLAWFTGGDTVYYKDWPISNTSLARSVKHDDYFYPGWKGMK